MRDLMILVLFTLIGVEPPVGRDQLIVLHDGGLLVIRKSGEMVHRDGFGYRLRMRDGEPMLAKSGTRYVMKNIGSTRS